MSDNRRDKRFCFEREVGKNQTREESEKHFGQGLGKVKEGKEKSRNPETVVLDFVPQTPE